MGVWYGGEDMVMCEVVVFVVVCLLLVCFVWEVFYVYYVDERRRVYECCGGVLYVVVWLYFEGLDDYVWVLWWNGYLEW